MTYLYFLLSLRSLYAVMHSGATVALEWGGGVSAMRSFFVLFGPSRACVSRRRSSAPAVGDSYRCGLGCLRIMVPARGGGATSRAAVRRRSGRRWRGEGGGGGLTRIETADHVLSATEAIGDAHAGSTTTTYHDDRCERDESPRGVCGVECGAVRGWYLGGTVGQFDEERCVWCFGTE